MNDSELIVWIAEHMTGFTPAFGNATMTYINDDGVEEKVTFIGEAKNPSCEEQLRGCIALALK